MYKASRLAIYTFSSLVKINHLFRGGKISVGKSARRRITDNPCMVEHQGTKPGKCHTGRWGAVGDVERYVVVPVEVLREIMDDAFFTDIDNTKMVMMKSNMFLASQWMTYRWMT